MKKVFTVIALLLATTAFGYSQVTNTQMSAQVFEGEIVVDAPAEKVWNVLTDLKQFSDVMGFKWQSGKEKVSQVGDTARMLVWSDSTTYFLTYVEPGKELRLALEPDNASYICQKKWILVPEGENKTKVILYDIYTESGQQSAEALQQQVEAWQGHLEKLKAMAEG